MTTPDWLTKSFLETALRSYKHDETIEVLNFDAKTGFTGHFASAMFQSKIEFKSLKFKKAAPETLNVVIKAMPLDEIDKMKILSDGPLFENEIQMYARVLPIMQQLLERSGLKNEIGPELIYATDKPFPVIVLQNMSQDGFSALSEQPAEFDDSKEIIEKLAEFHAASYFLAETGQEDFSGFNFSMYQNEATIKTFLVDALVTFKDVLKTWEGFDEYLPRLDKLIENIYKIGKAAYAANKPGNGYNVLNHGDFHIRNLLVKINEKKRFESVRFIDFQLSVYCSPAVDINYLLGTIKRDEDGNLPSDEIIMFYHQEFCIALKTFGFMKAPPTLLDLNIELCKHGAFSVVFLLCFVPYMFIDWGNVSFEDMMGVGEKGQQFKRSLYDHPTCRKMIQQGMKTWVHKGWF